MFAPTSEQSNVLGETLSVTSEQVSLLPLSTSAAVIPALFDASSATVIFFVNTVGGVVSFTVTVADAPLLLLLESVTVSVTAFAPIFEQLNVSGDTLSVTSEQLSLLPLSTSPPVILAFPDASSSTVIFFANAVGGV